MLDLATITNTPDPDRDALYTRAGELVASAGRVPEIVDDEMLSRAADLDRILAAQFKRVDEHRKSITTKLDAAKKEIMDSYRPTLDRITAAREQVKGRMVPYMMEKQRVEQERLRIEREEAERVRLAEAERLEAEAAKLRAEQAKAAAAGQADEARRLREQSEALAAQSEATLEQAVAPVAERKAAPTRGDLGGVSSLKMVVDRDKIQAAVDFGVREIAGVRVFAVWSFEIVDAALVPDSYKRGQVSTRG